MGANNPFVPFDRLTATSTAFLHAHNFGILGFAEPYTPAFRMRVPQELVDEIVSNMAYETDLEIFVRLLEASYSLFAPQISKLLPQLPVVLQRKRHYHALQDIHELFPEATDPSVRHVFVQLLKPLSTHNCEDVLLPSVLEACTDLRSLSFDLSDMAWSQATGSAAYRLFDVIQYSALESLSLSRVRFKKSDIDVFSALVLPATLRDLRLHQVEVSSSLYRAHLGAMILDANLQKPSLVNLTLDGPSLCFARMFTNAVFPCTSEDLRSLDYTPMSWIDHIQLRDLLRASPHLQHLTLRKGDDENYTSDHNLFGCAALCSLCICFATPAGHRTVPSVLRTIETIPETAPFELLTFAIPATGTIKKGGWDALEDALLRRRQSLRVMEMVFTPYKNITLSEGRKRGYVKVMNSLMPRLHCQGKLGVIVGEEI